MPISACFARRLIFCLPLLLAGLLAQSPRQSADVEVGAVAPRDCWTIRGGNPARTGHAATAPVFGDLVRSWTFRQGEAIEGEPLVWRDVVIVAVRDKERQRSLHVLDLLDGTPRVKARRFKSPVPLDPCISGEMVVARTNQKKIQAFRIGRTILDPKWSWSAKEPVGAPVLIGDEVYLPTETSLVRLRLRQRTPVWKTSGRFRGDLAVRGAHVYALSYGGAGHASLVAHARDDGKLASATRAGHHEGSVPALERPPALVAYRTGVAVHHALPVPTDAGVMEDATAFVFRSQRKTGRLRLRMAGLVEAPVPGVPGKKACVGPLVADNRAELFDLELMRGAMKSRPLTSDGRHREFAGVEVPLMRARNVVYCGARCFDLESRKILWDGKLELVKRPVPARDTLLVSTETNELIALRRHRSGNDDTPTVIATTSSGDRIPGARVALRDGSILAGEITIDRAAGKLTLEGKKKGRGRRKDWPLSLVTCLVDAATGIRYAPGEEAAVEGLVRLARDERARFLVGLCDRACAGGDVDQIAALLTRAQAAGAPESMTKNAQRRLDYLKKRPRPVKAAVRDAVATEAKSADARSAGFLWKSLEALPEDRSPSLELSLLRALLEADPKHEGGTRRVRERVPTGLPGRDTLHAAEWLDFIEATGQTPIQFVAPPAPDQGDTTRNQRELGSAIHTWRKDLIGIQSRNLLILTPLASPGQVARCLSMGEIVCETLEKMFTGLGKPRKARDPLILHLFQTKEEYEKEATKKYGPAAARARKALHFTAGHYDPDSNVTRIYLPESADAFESVRNTYAHEITHHWLATRAPRFGSGKRSRNLGTPCYFLVEGFATLIEEGRFDVESRTYASFDPRCHSLDVVGNSKPKQLIPWKLLLSINQLQFSTLPGEAQKGLVIPMRWRLGMARTNSPKRLFYDQGAATCQYLFHAEEGRMRAKLLELVARHYAGEATRESVREILGLSPDELGQAVRDYARKISGS